MYDRPVEWMVLSEAQVCLLKGFWLLVVLQFIVLIRGARQTITTARCQTDTARLGEAFSHATFAYPLLFLTR